MTGALVLAGGDKQDFTLEIAGVPMITRVVRAAAAVPQIETVVVVGPASLEPALAGAQALRIEPAGALTDNVRAGIQALASCEQILVLTADIPLINAAAIGDFIARCERENAEFYYAIVRKETYERRFPGSKRTYAKLRDGVFTGGNLFYLKRRVAGQALDLLERFYAVRKDPLKLARLFGFGFLAKLLLGRLTIAELERRAAQLAGVTGKAIETEYAEIGFDVDRAEDAVVAESFA